MASTFLAFADKVLILNVTTTQHSSVRNHQVPKGQPGDYSTLSTNIIHTLTFKNSSEKPNIFCQEQSGGCLRFSKENIEANIAYFKKENEEYGPSFYRNALKFSAFFGTLTSAFFYMFVGERDHLGGFLLAPSVVFGCFFALPIVLCGWSAKNFHPYDGKIAFYQYYLDFIWNDKYPRLTSDVGVSFLREHYQGTVVSQNGSLVLIPN